MQERAAFGMVETHGMLSQNSVRRRRCSEDKGWSSLFASSQVEMPFDGRFRAVEDPLIVLHRDGPVEIEGEGGTRPFRCTVPAGGVHLIPGGADFSIRLAGMLSTMHVYVRRHVLNAVAAELSRGDPEAITIAPGVLQDDPMLLALLKPVELALESRADDSAMGADYLALSLAAHLIAHHSNAVLRPRGAQRDGPAMSKTTQHAIAFMRDNLDRSIGLADIALAVARSTSHIARVFKSDLGTPPHRYLIGLRVERAKELLRRTDWPIAEIAAECGFTHQEHLTHQFRRLCDTTPGAYRRSYRN